MKAQNNRKGGPGSGPHRGQHIDKPRSGGNHAPVKPPGYSEQASSSNIGKPRAGVSPRDLFPERYDEDGHLKPRKT